MDERISRCRACFLYGQGARTRIAIPHTCGKETGGGDDLVEVSVVSGPNKGKKGLLFDKSWVGAKCRMKLVSGDGILDVTPSECRKNCGNCEFFAPKPHLTIFGTCEFSHQPTEANAVCAAHSFKNTK